MTLSATISSTLAEVSILRHLREHHWNSILLLRLQAMDETLSFVGFQRFKTCKFIINETLKCQFKNDIHPGGSRCT